MLFNAKRTILVVSPQAWDGIPVSKHNYADELARLGHRVVFLDPPVLDGSVSGLRLSQTGTPGIEVLRYRTPFPYALKFHARPLFDHLMGRLARRFAAAMGEHPDIVWDFDNAYTTPDLRAFGTRCAIFHLVDDINPRRNGDKHADVVLAVAQRFLDKVTPRRVPMHVIPHGLARGYEALAREVLASPARPSHPGRPLCVGFVGNLDRPDIDWNIIARLIEANPAVTFRFTGPVSPAAIKASRHGAAFAAIRGAANVIFEGRKKPEDIIARAPTVDVWLLAYDPEANANAATNSHKLLEYLGTGSPVVSHRVEAYAGSDLIAMPQSSSNADLPGILARVLANLDALNTPDLRARRAAFALDHTYKAQLKQISAHLDEAAAVRRQQGRVNA